MRRLRRSQRGLSLVEVAAAGTVVAVGLVGTAASLVPASKLTQNSVETREIARVSGALLEEVRATRLEGASRTLEAAPPPGDLEDVHATLVSGVHLAREAIARRRTAAATAGGSFSRDASSAAAGALMLIGQARSDLVARLYPPRPPGAR